MCMQNLKFLAPAFHEIRRGTKILKVGHLTPFCLFNLILFFFSQEPILVIGQSVCQILSF